MEHLRVDTLQRLVVCEGELRQEAYQFVEVYGEFLFRLIKQSQIAKHNLLPRFIQHYRELRYFPEAFPRQLLMDAFYRHTYTF